jgi:diguanylate cyclase (GGDEF)-like protein/PAS domain S-box-containing protein
MIAGQDFRAIFDLAADAMFILDQDRCIREINQIAYGQLGYTKPEMLGRHIGDFISPEFVPLLKNRYATVQNQGYLIYESAMVHKDGSVLPVEICNRVIELGGKKTFFAVVRDISERKRMDTSLRESEARFRTLSEDGPEAIVIHDLETGLFVDATSSAERLFGCSRDEILRHGPQYFYAPDQPAGSPSFSSIRERGERIMAGEQMKFERLVRNKNGQDILCEVRLVRLPSANRKLIRASYLDIAERKQKQGELEAALEFSENLIGTMQDGFSVLDKHGQTLDANPALCHITGFSREELIGISAPFPYWPPEEYENIQAAFQKTLKGEVSSFELTFMRKSGERFPVIVSPSTVQDRKGNIISYTATVKDISERKRAESKITASEEKWRLLFENMTTGFALHEVICNEQGTVVDYRFLEINPAYEQLTGLKASNIIGRTVLEVLPGTEPYWIEIFGRVALFGEPTVYENYSKEIGRWYQVRVFSPKIGQFAVIVSDITERKNLEESLRLSSLVLEHSSEGMVVTDADNLIIAVNPAFSSITGYSFDEVKGKNPRIFKSGNHDAAFYQKMWQVLHTSGQWRGEIWDRRKNGEIHAKLLTINTIRNEDGSVHRYVALFSDITERTLSEELIWRQANFDTLTGLPNRNMFRDRLEQEVKKADREDRPLALLLIDLDQFKEVNDTLGHAVGDLLLKDAACRIISCVREADTVARLGGDEFTVVLSEISDNSHVDDVAQKIIRKLSEPFHLVNEVVFVSASVGITLYPIDTTDIDALMKNADQAMYVAKNRGRNRSSYFTTSLQEAAQAKLRMTNDLRGALEARQFMVHFQPIIELSTGSIHKAEALLRWQHPERGMVGPMEFIPLAEESGLINEIGDWVFKESARWAKHWCNLFGDDFQVSVNKSPVQFRNENYHFAEKWFEHLQSLGISGRNMVIEITEGLLLNADAHVADELLKFRDAGINVAIDDFGTGYSSLSYLKKFDIDYLKIDQSFVNNLETDPDNMALSEAIIVMAHKLGIKVIAEGIETEGQRKLLTAAGCDYGQGYLFSRPVPPEDLERLISMGKP